MSKKERCCWDIIYSSQLPSNFSLCLLVGMLVSTHVANLANVVFVNV
jgi:hypothetical protein